ncbi:MAG TPA: nucleotide sugar dehydrogenase [Nitrososphaerales archaeon]|nr:nucleotide sugar dehydrogenase [Nitrososphaerales archaeon]
MKDKISVIGVGYIGLPLATAFASSGFEVIGLDVNQETIDRINSGTIDDSEPGLSKMVNKAVESGNLKVTIDTDEALRNTHIFIVCVQTPINDDYESNLDYLKNALMLITKYLDKGDFIVIESTIPPGTMEFFVKPFLEETSLKVGSNLFLAYCCENVFPTNILEETMNNDKIIGSFDAKSSKLAVELYSRINKGTIRTTDTKTAELVKISENVFRDVNIALANEMAIIFKKMGVDIRQIIKLSNYNKRVNIHNPGCGVGGSCLPKDPYFLINAANKYGIELKLIETARKVNNSMPDYTLNIIKQSLDDVGIQKSDAIITIFGVTYKGDVVDIRNSPAKEIIEKLLPIMKEVRVHDFLSTETFGGKKSNNLNDSVTGSNCVVILNNHAGYRKIDFRKIVSNMAKKSVIVDTADIVNIEARKENYVSI